jgi:hypothetical protein
LLRDLSISIRNPQEKSEVGEELQYNYFKCSQEWKGSGIYMENGLRVGRLFSNFFVQNNNNLSN